MLKKQIMEKSMRKKKGQSTVEYIILVAAVIAVLIWFLAPNGLFYNAFNSTLQQGTNGMTDMANRLATSRYDQP